MIPASEATDVPARDLVAAKASFRAALLGGTDTSAYRSAIGTLERQAADYAANVASAAAKIAVQREAAITKAADSITANIQSDINARLTELAPADHPKGT